MFDDKDSQDPQQREADLFKDFGQRLHQAATVCPGLSAHLAGQHNNEQPGEQSLQQLLSINDRHALQQLPVLRKSELMLAQQKYPPFGGFVQEEAIEGCRVFMSPGPVWEPQLPGADPWATARALHAAGIRRGHRVHNAFSYHTTPGGFMLDEGARALGCVVFPAGVGGTDVQVQAAHQLGAQVYVGTPDYLQVLLDHAADQQQPLTHMKRALVSGGALFPTMRTRYQEQGIHVQQCYATADLGVIAYETATDDTIHQGMVVNEGLIVEILIPGTNSPVAPGTVGEVVVTRLHPVYPLLRFATGDLSAQIDEPSPCGRSAMRLAGWMGRADQRTKVRGMFVDPVQLQQLPKAHPELTGWRLSISRVNDRDNMHLSVSVSADSLLSDAALQKDFLQKLVATLKSATGLSASADVVDTLPNDGLVIDDRRDYQQG